MVKTFHLHNCGNSVDFCEFTFLYAWNTNYPLFQVTNLFSVA